MVSAGTLPLDNLFNITFFSPAAYVRQGLSLTVRLCLAASMGVTLAVHLCAHTHVMGTRNVIGTTLWVHSVFWNVHNSRYTEIPLSLNLNHSETDVRCTSRGGAPIIN